ncbi:penicillin-binding protein [Breznakiella homolactica]|uniref:Transpeptidase family protein n=1 Tax=Breznakiella homolactica TaxID=2798577 RepID=A0A7T7XKY2_9SPIR|nr:penicillin-binding protein [Breznakiella homolactica]QQO08324.1 transpeptidase family protein [Breznakiella homolactica]
MSDTEDNRHTSPPPSKKRFIIFASMLALAALYIVVRYVVVMVNPPDTNPFGPRRSFVERGPILDRNGRILAIQTRLGNITLWKPEADDMETLIRELSPVLETPPEVLRDTIEFSYSDFVYLKRRADQSTVKAVEEAKAEGRLRGVGIEPIVGRIYPEKNLASQIIGFVGDDNTGLAGIEYAFDQQLGPNDGSPGGSQIILTIDANVQHILEEIARKTYTENEAEAVMLMAMDPRSGEILGSASIPDFDPNDIRASDERSRMDRPAIWAYEPGSVFKIFSLAALMDSGAIRGNTVFTCNGRYERVTNLGERITIRCLGSHGPVTARDIIIYSCNAGAAYAADRLDAASFYQGLRNFGFGGRTGAGAPGETAGFLRPVERWSERSKPTITMGQEIAVSALQMVQAASAIANDGILIPPKIVSRIVSPDGRSVRPYESGQAVRILDSETAQAIRSYMVDVTSGIGTGWRANVEDLSLAVKTGTAQLIDSSTGAYSDEDFIASCIALLPAESPSLVLYLVIVKPKSEYLGGRIAAPPIREAAEALVDYLGIPRGRNPQISHSGEVSITANPAAAIGETMPDLTGYSKRQLLPLILREDIRVEVIGDGWVRRQNPPAGTPVSPGDTVTLELE